MNWNTTKKKQFSVTTQKSDTKTIQPVPRKMFEVKNMMTTQPGTIQNSKSQPNGSSTTQQIFRLQLQEPIIGDQTNTQVWSYNIPVLNSNQKILMLQILGGQLVIVGLPTANFPTQMYVSCGTMNGYNDNNADPTNVIGIYRIRQLIPCVQGGITTYTIIYTIMENITWNLGLNRTLTFTFGDDTGPYTTPLAQSVFLQLKIIHVAY